MLLQAVTDICSRFGFVKYFKFEDAEDCIRGFHFCGYETSFARESFYSQLKKLADTDATNLYISNLPLEYNEHDLGEVFQGYEVCSKRILRNPDGSGRGVGFARFANHDVCEQVIRDYNNHSVVKGNGEAHSIQIRYADTPEQKALKQQTTAARQYRSAEYESQTQSAGPFMTRFDRCQEFGPYLAVPNGQINAPDHNAHATRANAVSAHLSPSSAVTAINVNLPQNGVVANGKSPEDDDTIQAPVVAPIKQDVEVEQ